MTFPLSGWIDCQTTVHLWDWAIDTVHPVNADDPEIQKLIEFGYLVPVNEETRKLLPPPRTTISPGGCGCGK